MSPLRQNTCQNHCTIAYSGIHPSYTRLPFHRNEETTYLERNKTEKFLEQRSRSFEFLPDFSFSYSPTDSYTLPRFFFPSSSFHNPPRSLFAFIRFLCTCFCRILCSFGDINVVRSCLFIALQTSVVLGSANLSLFLQAQTSLLILFFAPRISPYLLRCSFLFASFSLVLVLLFVPRRYPLHFCMHYSGHIHWDGS